MLDRLRAAVGPGLRVEGILGSGGMGVVFHGVDTLLDRAVAIKVLRPELATAVAAERFLREARVLARLSHPNVVPIHQAGQAAGLFYFVMDRIDGETLADRLERGPLNAEEFAALRRDLLAAIRAMHAAGVIHRDLKPANILLCGGRALVADFGIAREDGTDSDLTRTGAVFGTPAYMAPEQALGQAATTAADVYAAGAILFEAATGRRFAPTSAAQWEAVPEALAAALRHALEMDPASRWPDAGSFAAALEPPPARRRAGIAIGVAAAVLGVAVLARLIWPGDGPPPPTLPGVSRLVIAPIARPAAVSDELADSIQAVLTGGLQGYPDIEAGPGPAGDSDRVLTVSVHQVPNGIRLEASLGGGNDPPIVRAAAGRPGDWRRLVDTVSLAIAAAVLEGTDPWLPRDALPRDPRQRPRYHVAEQAFAAGRWEDARAGYAEVFAADSSCLLCLYRLDDVARWLAQSHDSSIRRTLRAGIDRFPQHYRELIRASDLPLAERLDSLAVTAPRYREFSGAWFRFGEEGFHRGPLVGRLRREAGPAFRRLTAMAPRFAAGWNHRAWLAIVEGDSAAADSAMTVYRTLESGATGYSLAQMGLLEVAWAWRFGPAARGPAVTAAVADDPRLPSQLLLPGPRMLLGFGVFDGAIWLGRRFAASAAADEWVRSGLIAVALGEFAMGRPDSMRAALAELGSLVTDPPTQLFAAGLPAIAALVDGAVGRPDQARELAGPIGRFAGPDQRSVSVRRGAALLVGLLGIKGGAPELDRLAEAALDRSRPDDGAALAVLDLFRKAAAGDTVLWPAADRILAGSPQLLIDQPALRGIVRLEVARQFVRLGRTDGAALALRWVEHDDVAGLPAEAPLVAELDWVMGPFAREIEAGLPDTVVPRRRRCQLAGELDRVWRDAASRYRRRAAAVASTVGWPACTEGR